MTEIYSPRLRSGARPTPQPPQSPTAKVLQAIGNFVGRLQSRQLQPVAPADAPMGYQPKVLLALLTFYYARRFYASHEIELAIRQDPELRALCGQDYPDARALRRFRRHNRDLLRECLAHTLADCAGAAGAGRSAAGSRPPDPRLPLGRSTGTSSIVWLHEAEQHIEQAVLLDSVEADV